MTNQATSAPTYCTSCDEPTATPPDCEDCRAGKVDALAVLVLQGRWQYPTKAEVLFLLEEVSRLRDTIARRGEEYDTARHARDDAEERARYHQNKRSQDARDMATVTRQRDDAWAELVDLRAENSRMAVALDHDRGRLASHEEALAQALAARNRLAVQVQAMRDWADQMEAEAPKPAAGGFFTDEVRRVLDSAAVR